ncbi:MAG: molybdopterin-dependent oxidoreductase, partial [Candidatus Latescibacteria bacterium]|nr:molybdopterin-dependent oxidoreductase [Candidatus Latescibacterota bacterium]
GHPRFSRTSALADLWLPIRAGTDIVFLGGLVRYVLENELFFRDYVVHYTNASVILREDFRDTEDLDGLFSGWDDEKMTYDHESWSYEGDDPVRPRRDPTLAHPRCVFQVLKRHFSRYTPERVEEVPGIPQDLFLDAAEKIAAASGPEKTAAICYAVGWTQHSKGVQIIRTAAILQLLLGNIGRPGGGILALRGHASIQGSTDIPTLYDILPGYMPMPKWGTGEETIDSWVANHGKKGGLWSNIRKYLVSLLKAWYGTRAHAGNDFGWRFVPRTTHDHSHFRFFTEMDAGKVEGFFVMGQNPAVGAVNSRFQRKALAKLRWLVVRDLVETETAAFWKDGPEIERGELDPAHIETEVFLFSAAGHAEKEGSFTNTQRLLQWREKAVDPPGEARSDSWFVHQLAKRLREKALASEDPEDEPLRALDWWYPENELGEPEMEAVLAEINGFRTDPGEGPEGVVLGDDREGRPHDGPQVPGLKELEEDGTTACGCWIYSGVYGPDGVNRARQRDPEDALGHGWGFAWPSDRRILYNRASARPDGAPWSERKKLVWYGYG